MKRIAGWTVAALVYGAAVVAMFEWCRGVVPPG